MMTILRPMAINYLQAARHKTDGETQRTTVLLASEQSTSVPIH